MRKHLKSIAAAIMAVAMLIRISTSAMAAEQTPAVGGNSSVLHGDGVVLYEDVPDIYNDSSVWLQKNRVLKFSLTLSESTRTVQYKLVGNTIGTSGKKVTFRFTNNANTNQSRTFTATANGNWSSTTYATSYPAGDYTLSVESVEMLGTYGVYVIFLP